MPRLFVDHIPKLFTYVSQREKTRNLYFHSILLSKGSLMPWAGAEELASKGPPSIENGGHGALGQRQQTGA